ncbi:MAG: serine protein kinase RIO [Candidatus Thermoplasmatota archaeon]
MKKIEDLRKTEGEVFEKTTLGALAKLMNDGFIDYIDFPISTGKEGNVFRGVCGEKLIAIKIYRINTATFRSISKYLMYDPPEKIKFDRRNIIFAWAKKEFGNLKKLHQVGVRVPEPIAIEGNVIIMEYIGSKAKPAPLLKDANIKNAEKIFEKIRKYLKLMYQKAKLVHADFSEYNILIYRNNPVIIDVGQTVKRENPMAMEFLRRDVYNIVKFFKKFINIEEEDTISYIMSDEDEVC